MSQRSALLLLMAVLPAMVSSVGVWGLYGRPQAVLVWWLVSVLLALMAEADRRDSPAWKIKVGLRRMRRETQRVIAAFLELNLSARECSAALRGFADAIDTRPRRIAEKEILK